jgi:hypothetical protein
MLMEASCKGQGCCVEEFTRKANGITYNSNFSSKVILDLACLDSIRCLVGDDMVKL